MIESTASKSSPPARAQDDPPRGRTKATPLVWLNLVCLDAPIVAVCWLALFARQLGIGIPHSGTAALFLSAWLIYLADRLLDNLSLGAHLPVSLRQDFCRRHRVKWLLALVFVGLADAFVITTSLDRRVLSPGTIVGIFALLYFLTNQLAPFVWQKLPLKEISIGFLFAAGMAVPMAAGLTRADLWPIFFFGILCAMNCICIAVWEQELDRAQARISIAIVLPKVERIIIPSLLAVAASTAALSSTRLAACLSASAILLALVHLFRNRIQPDIRTALADLVLLTPLAWLAR